MTDTPTGAFSDGNMLAGPLGSVFAIDVTTAVTHCVECGRRSAIAELRVYDAGPGLVARCVGCNSVILRWAETEAGGWLDLRGTVSVQFPAPLDA